jgi:sideroflexin-5
VTDADLWRARKVKEAIVHPDTGEAIPRPFRMAGFVPFGTPVVVGLLLPHQTLATTLFWQALNQTHNAAVNYCNRNASRPTPPSLLVAGYVGAVTSAVTVAGGLLEAVRRTRALAPATRALALRLVPYPAVATANVCNLVLMRLNELREGIAVTASDGTVLGHSRVAARRALADTALTRVVLPAPILILPALVMTALERTRWLRAARPATRLAVQTVVCTGAFAFALPLAISLFPQVGALPAAALEPPLAAAAAAAGVPTVSYNKGL